MNEYRHIFGPVPSRRFGRSLGIDLTPFKTCSFDCVFCQLGRTEKTSFARAEFVPVDDVINEIADWLKNGGAADFMSLAGSGEPTLNSRFGDVLEFIARNTNIPSALLTNGTTLYLPEVRAAACAARVVKVSLSAWDQNSLEQINRPHTNVVFDELIAAQQGFRAEFQGELWVEVFIVEGINSEPGQVLKLAGIVDSIKPDRIQLNTAARPAAEKWVEALSRESLESVARLFGPKAEIIADFKSGLPGVRADSEAILKMLRRHPCTLRQIADVFSMHINEALKHMGMLTQNGAVCVETKNGEDYYSVS